MRLAAIALALAVAGLGMIPLPGIPVAPMLGALLGFAALTLGVIARQRAEQPTRSRRMAWASTVIGSIAVLFGLAMFVGGSCSGRRSPDPQQELQQRQDEFRRELQHAVEKSLRDGGGDR